MLSRYYDFVADNYYLITGIFAVILTTLSIKFGYDIGKDVAYDEMHEEELETENELLKEMLGVEEF